MVSAPFKEDYWFEKARLLPLARCVQCVSLLLSLLVAFCGPFLLLFLQH